MPPPLSASAPLARPSLRLTTFAVVLLYACATLQFVRFYAVSATPYLNLPRYLAGQERLPFQYRILPAFLIRGFYAVHLLHPGAMHAKGAFTPDRAPLYLLGLIGFAIAACCTQAIYASLSSSRRLQLLVFPVFLYTVMWSYTIHVEANFSYPYDLLGVAFFAAGLLCIVRRHYLPLVAVIALGTLNRETTVFLVGIYLLDAGSSLPSRQEVGAEATIRPRAPSLRRLQKLPWLRAGLLLLVWLAVKAFLAHQYGHNDRSEDYVRFRDNLGELKPRLWPALLNICGYMLPVVILFRRNVFPVRFRNYLWILPAWFAVMFYAGVIAETRIYGELCPYTSVALTLLLEDRLQEPTVDQLA